MYTAQLEVDGEVQSSSFELKINPNESYSKRDIDRKYAYWMEMYQLSLDYSEKIAQAMAAHEEVLKKAEANPELQEKAEAVTEAFQEYKGTFVPFGRTLAEIINQPAKLFSKLVWLHNMAESSEGPPNNTSVAQFEDIKVLMAQAEAEQGAKFQAALVEFNAAAQ